MIRDTEYIKRKYKHTVTLRGPMKYRHQNIV